MTFGGYRKKKSSHRQTAHHGGTRMDHVFPDDDAGIEDLKILLHVASIYPYIMTVKRLPTC
jgi:hypothetical protein